MFLEDINKILQKGEGIKKVPFLGGHVSYLTFVLKYYLNMCMFWCIFLKF